MAVLVVWLLIGMGVAHLFGRLVEGGEASDDSHSDPIRPRSELYTPQQARKELLARERDNSRQVSRLVCREGTLFRNRIVTRSEPIWAP